MRFTSLVIELIRARPRLVMWIVVLSQAALWLILPLLLYRSPPGDLATVLAYGREYQVGTTLGPPLAFWLADIAFRAAGNHMFGVYLLAQLCAVATFSTLYLLAPAMGIAAAALLATDRAEQAQRLVCLVDRSRIVTADNAGRDWPLDPDRGVCAGNLTRTAHAEIVRSPVRAARDYRAGAALSDLAD